MTKLCGIFSNRSSYQVLEVPRFIGEMGNVWGARVFGILLTGQHAWYWAFYLVV